MKWKFPYELAFMVSLALCFFCRFYGMIGFADYVVMLFFSATTLMLIVLQII